MESRGRQTTGREVLVIDDSDIALDVIRGVLDMGGFETLGQLSPIGATNLVVKHGIRVVVTDVNMPEISGTQLSLMFRNNPRTEHVKVVLVSDLPPEQLYILGKNARAHGVVQKRRLEQDLVPLVDRLYRDQNFRTGPMSARSIDPFLAFQSAAQTFEHDDEEPS